MPFLQDRPFGGVCSHQSGALGHPGNGLPESTSASYVEMQCGSAIDSINHAAWRVLAGHADIMIAGGMESYSQACARFSMATEPFRMIPPMPS